jgi:hypothetical protein
MALLAIQSLYSEALGNAITLRRWRIPHFVACTLCLEFDPFGIDRSHFYIFGWMKY